MNAASLLKYFFQKKLIKISGKEMHEIAYSIGSDVALGLEKKIQFYLPIIVLKS